MKKILFFEDNFLISKNIIKRLVKNGYDITHLDSYKDGLNINGVYDLAIFDFDLGDGDGLELSKILISKGLFKLCIFYSSCTEIEKIHKAEQIGYFVDKLEIEKLFRRVNQLLHEVKFSGKIQVDLSIGSKNEPILKNQIP